MVEIYAERLAKLCSLMQANNLEALLVMRPENRRYLSGFSGDGSLLVTCDNHFLFTDGRFVEQAQQESPGWEAVLVKNSFIEVFAGFCQGRVREFGFEDDFLTYRQIRQFEHNLPGVGLRPVHGLVEQLRLIKDAAEIELIRQAGVITAAAIKHVLGKLWDGQTEQEIAGTMEFFMRCHGGGLPAFETIVASGERGALPHGVATAKTIRSGELIVMDLGATYRGYAADLTRTVCLGRFRKQQRKVYEVVRDAQERALALIRPGATTGEADMAAREIITAAGYGEYFNHSLGHGVGLAIHEEPRITPGGNVVLEPGMVFTVEPGVYLPGRGGVRIEDTVLVTRNGCEILTPVKKELLVI